MSQRVTIYGPNIGRGGEMHVHREGCADTKRGEYLRTDPPWYLDATSQKHVVENVYADIIAESPGSTWEDYASEIRFFPCTDLPEAEIVLTIAVEVKIDPAAWAEAYGLPADEVECDVNEHVGALVREAASQAIERIGAGAEVTT